MAMVLMTGLLSVMCRMAYVFGWTYTTGGEITFIIGKLLK